MPNWIYAIIVVAVLGVLVALRVINIKEWLLYAVTYAEEQLGGGTGALKLRMVYDMLISQWGFLGRLLPFALFSTFVDSALTKMRTLLETNSAVKELVKGEAQ